MRRAPFALALLLGIALDAAAMVAEPTRLAVWRKGETIGGEEFVAVTEAVVDYIGTLRRPTEIFKAIRYDCVAKSRLIRPSVRPTAQGTTQQTIEVRAVYELRDCTEVP